MKNILSEITEQEKNRILEMHRKSTSRFYLNEEEEGGPIVGKLVNQLGEINATIGQTLQFKFSDLRNAGKLPVTITKIMPSSESMTVNLKTPITLQPGETLPELIITNKLVQDATTLQPDSEGKINFDVPVSLFTQTNKKYTVYCRATITLK